MLKQKEYNLTLLYVFIFVVTFCPLIGAWIPFFSRTWIFYLIGCVASVIIVPQFYTSRIFIAILMYLLIVFLKFLAGSPYFKSISMVLSSSAEMVFSISVMYYLFYKKDIKLMGQFAIVTLIILFILTIGTYIAEQSYPGAVRYVASMYSSGKIDALGNALMRMGMTNYSLPHALPILIPPLVGGIRNKELLFKYRLFCIMALVACIAIIFLAGAATPVLLSIALVIWSFLLRPASRNNTGIIVFMFFISTILVFRQDFGRLMVEVGGGTSSEGAGMTIGSRISEMGQYLISGEEGEDLEGRTEHYETTINSLFENVIWGKNKVGGHSAILDRFVLLGILGFTPWIAAIIMSIRKFYIVFKNRKSLPFYTAGVLAAIVMLLAKNMTSFTMWFTLFVLLPIFMRFCDADKHFTIFDGNIKNKLQIR